MIALLDAQPERASAWEGVKSAAVSDRATACVSSIRSDSPMIPEWASCAVAFSLGRTPAAARRRGRPGRRRRPPRGARRSWSRPGTRGSWSRQASYSACSWRSSARTAVHRAGRGFGRGGRVGGPPDLCGRRRTGPGRARHVGPTDCGGPADRQFLDPITEIPRHGRTRRRCRARRWPQAGGEGRRRDPPHPNGPRLPFGRGPRPVRSPAGLELAVARRSPRSRFQGSTSPPRV